MDIFDEFNESSFSNNPFDTTNNSDEYKTSSNNQGINHNQEQIDRIFTYDRLEMMPYSDSPLEISQIVVMNGIMVMGTSLRSIVRLRLNGNAPPEELEISRKETDKIKQFFLDFSGNHLIVVMESGDTFYLHQRTSKPKKLSKFQGQKISAISFDPHLGGESQTRPFLVGTEDGEIYEATVDSSGTRSFHHLYSIEEGFSITDMYFEFSHTPSSSSSSSSQPPQPSCPMYLMVVTSSPSTRLYLFAGQTEQGAFIDLFAPYRDGTSSQFFTEIPGYGDKATLSIFYKEPRGRAHSFGIRTGFGIYYGGITPLSPLTSPETTVMDVSMIPYPTSALSDIPISFALTEFHVILLMPTGVRIVNRLDSSSIQFDSAATFGGRAPFTITRDTATNTLWVATTNGIFQVVADREKRHIWNVYLERAKNGEEDAFDFAYSQCSTPEQRESVHRVQAKYYMEKGDYLQAARFFAKTSISFEAVSLAFIESDQTEALQVFVEEKLEYLPPSATTQKMILSTWAIELILKQLYNVEIDRGVEDREERREDLIAQFCQLVERNKTHFHPETVIHMLLSHDRTDLCAFFSQAVGNVEIVVSHCLLRGQGREVLEMLAHLPESKSCAILYTYAPTLIAIEPKKTVDLLMSFDSISTSRLMPALIESPLIRKKRRAVMKNLKSSSSSSKRGGSVSLEKLKSDELAKQLSEVMFPSGLGSNEEKSDDIDAIDEEDASIEEEMQVCLENYLMFLVRDKRCRDLPVINLLFDLYIQSGNEDAVINLLHLHSFIRRVVDLGFLQRQCAFRGLTSARVVLYSLMNLHKKAVRLALSIDVDLAKEQANKVKDSTKKRELWLEIASSLASSIIQETSEPSNEEIGGLLGVIEESSGVVEIQDILTLFPHITKMEQFKDEIVRALENYNDTVEDLRVDMQDFEKTSEQILKEIETVEKNEVIVTPNQTCSCCNTPASSRQFYAFPCSHVLHVDCLLSHVSPFLTREVSREVERLVGEVDKLDKRVSSSTAHVDLKTVQKLDALQMELDGFVAGECPFCGEVMITSVQLPLISEKEQEEMGEEWNIDWD